MSASANIVKWSEHAKLYKTALLNSNCLIIVGEDANGRIGMVRFESSHILVDVGAWDLRHPSTLLCLGIFV